MTNQYRWVVYPLWATCQVSGYMIVATLGLLLPSISSDLSLSPSQQGLLGSAAYWGNMVLTLPFALIASQFKPKPLTTITLALGTVCLFLQGWAPVFALLIVGRLAFGISILAREPARAMLIQQWFPAKESVLANGVSNAMFGLIVGSGLIITPLIIEASPDWRIVLRIFGVMFSVLTVSWALLGKERMESKQEVVSSRARLLFSSLRHRDLWLGGSGFIGTNFVWSSFLSFYPTMMQDTYGFSLRWSGSILAISIMVGGLSGIFLSYIVMTTGKRKTILVVMGTLMTLTYIGMTLTDSITVLLTLSFLNGIAWGFYPILYTLPFHIPGLRNREIVVATAAIVTMTATGTGIGPVFVGILQEILGNLNQALLIVSFASLSLSISGLIIKPTTTN